MSSFGFQPVVTFAADVKVSKGRYRERAEGKLAASKREGPTELRWHNRKVLADGVVRAEVKEHKPFSMWNVNLFLNWSRHL